MLRYRIIVCLVLCSVYNIHTNIPKAAVTYTFSGGRLGDNLIAYMHAKWIAYHFDIPLLYKPFTYSDQLTMHDIEQYYNDREIGKRFNKMITFNRGDILSIDRNSPTLYVIPFFPECLSEVESPCCSAFYFSVPWDDAGFKEELRKCIRPRNSLSLMSLPNHGIAIAVHVRKTSNGMDFNLSQDYPEGINTPNVQFMDVSYPFKMPPDTYYIEQIKNIAHLFNNQQLYVYILSDDKDVDKIMEKYCQAAHCPNLRFFSRPAGKNSHDINVLEDFFFIAQCQCLIRSESNFALAASKLGNYLVHIIPSHHQWREGHLVIDEAKIVMRKNPITTDYVWIWPHACSWCRCKK